ncbi:hypothetical protein GCM10017600_73810 [Streptosporangium carneum]|uniref:Uncharacterized protein n=1 Tax=Streptosporangium carneum TaxID=47481 RepID=A0A9W6IAF6_9ACTN|nr:hypothetical protein GCM10017600_73810 [Streptosporangium carneum]
MAAAEPGLRALSAPVHGGWPQGVIRLPEVTGAVRAPHARPGPGAGTRRDVPSSSGRPLTLRARRRPGPGPVIPLKDRGAGS